MDFPRLDSQLNFNLTGEWSKQARKIARELLLPQATKADQQKIFPQTQLNELAEQGFYTLCLPKEDGGAGVSTLEYAEVIRELAYGCASTAIMVSVSNMVATIANQFAHKELLNELQKKFRTRTPLLLAFAITEPQAGSDAKSIQTSYEKTPKGYIPDGYLINGHKCFITSGSHADYFLATARNSRKTDELSAFLIPKTAAGLRIGKEEKKMGLRASSTVQLFFDKLSIPSNHLLGNEGDGFKIAMSALTGGRIGVAAQAIGLANLALQEARRYEAKYLKSQSNRWMMVEQALALEAGMLLIYDAARFADKAAASRAKLFCTEIANRCVDQLSSCMGDQAFDNSSVTSRLLRDLKVTTIYEGTSEIQRMVIARELLKQPVDAIL